jgi:hypothetical protein
MKLLTTGHSLGGAMATAFAGEWVQQISTKFVTGAEIFDINIGCYSLASPRIFGPKEAALFCCLTQANFKCKVDNAAALYVKTDGNVKGKISYLRVVTALDLVTALPKIGYQHPCSEFKENERNIIMMDCDIDKTKFVTNKISPRCLNLTHKRPAMTADYSKAPACTNLLMSPLSIYSILYHLTYVGIMFAGAVDMNSTFSLDVERLQKEDVNAAAINPTALGIKVNDTMMRLLFYGFNNTPVAKCVFFDLVPFRVNETMSGGGWFGKKSATPASPASTASAPAPASKSAAPASAPASTASAPAPASKSATPASSSTDSSKLYEDSQTTLAFITSLKIVISNAKYDYPILNAAVTPPILYKGTNYNYLYQLPAMIAPTNTRLFFGNENQTIVAPPVVDHHTGNLIHKSDQDILDNHNADVANHSAAIASGTALVGGRTRRIKKCSRRHKKNKCNNGRISRRKCNKRH